MGLFLFWRLYSVYWILWIRNSLRLWHLIKKKIISFLWFRTIIQGNIDINMSVFHATFLTLSIQKYIIFVWISNFTSRASIVFWNLSVISFLKESALDGSWLRMAWYFSSRSDQSFITFDTLALWRSSNLRTAYNMSKELYRLFFIIMGFVL